MAEQHTVRVHFIDGSERIVPAKDIRFVGEEGARSATALVDGREVPIYNRVEWGYLWYEQEARTDTIENITTSVDDTDIDDWLARNDLAIARVDDGSGLHQCPYCYNLVNSEHEEFCSLNPNRNRNIVP